MCNYTGSSAHKLLTSDFVLVDNNLVMNFQADQRAIETTVCVHTYGIFMYCVHTWFTKSLPHENTQYASNDVQASMTVTCKLFNHQ